MSALSESLPSSTCPTCGARDFGVVTHGLCPACLLAGIMIPTGPKSHWNAPSPEELAIMLPQYQIQSLLGRGGMGAVYRGSQVELDRTIAIKILPGDLNGAGQGFAGRFKLEARAMARLKHPGIVTVYDFGQTAEGLLYFVMEFVEGMDVQAMISQEGRIHSADAIAIGSHVCEALHYAHSHGIIHRDIKPANVIVGFDGHVRVADFGLAKVMNADQTSGLTLSGSVMGTPNYLAPEALILGMDLDLRVDIYAVGVMLYHMLTGKVPYGAFEMPSVRIPGLDPRLDTIINRAMLEDRDQRYQSAEDLRNDLVNILTQPVAQTVIVPAKDEVIRVSLAAATSTARSSRAGIYDDYGSRDEPAYDRVTTQVMLHTAKSMNTTTLVLGTTALLILGALAFFLANRKTGDTYHSEETITNIETNNTYFTQIIAAGLATTEDLQIISEIRPYDGGFIGVTREARSWTEVRELAEKAGASVLSVDEESAGSRAQLLTWLTSSYSTYLTSDAWVQERGEARLVQGMKVVPAAGLDEPRKALLYWKIESQSTTRSETIFSVPKTPVVAPMVPTIQPAPEPEKTVPPEWTNLDSRVIRAEFVEISGEAVVIRGAGGQLFTVPFSTLAPASVEQAMKLAKQPK